MSHFALAHFRKGRFGMATLYTCFRDCLVSLLGLTALTSCYDFDIIDRDGWHARTPVLVEPMTNPVPFVIIHHSYRPPACNTSEQCIEAMQWMQDLHQITNGWNDIGYSFAVGGDAKVYMGRGWSRVGAHAPSFNNRSIGICIIGDWRAELPPKEQLRTVHKLIDYGVELGKIAPDYTLFGHRQVREGTECPGDKLFKEISTWDHFSPDEDTQPDSNTVPTR